MPSDATVCSVSFAPRWAGRRRYGGRPHHQVTDDVVRDEGRGAGDADGDVPSFVEPLLNESLPRPALAWTQHH